MTSFPGNCIECNKPLVSYEAFARHGWLNMNVSWTTYARVHTLCKEKFLSHSPREQIEMAKKQMGVYE